MTSISVYGAGYYANKAIPALSKAYAISHIMDRSPDKQGGSMHGIPILPVCKAHADAAPVMILIQDIESALIALEEVECRSDIYFTADVRGGYLIWKYERVSDNRKDNILCAVRRGQPERVDNPVTDFENAGIAEGPQPYQKDAPRIFNMTSLGLDAKNIMGGPGACLNNLRLANEAYGLIENLYSIAANAAFIPAGGDCRARGAPFERAARTDALFTLLNAHSEALPASTFIWYYHEYLSAWQNLMAVHARLQFTKQDVFLVQEPLLAHAFHTMFPQCENLFMAYHVQGTMASQDGRNSPALMDFYNDMQLEQLRRIKHWIFPSRGAISGFLRTATPAMRDAAGQCAFHVAYNGYERKQAISPDPAFEGFLNQLDKYDHIFASASFLYKNKGVERIPRILSEIKQATGKTIHWVLVGDGDMHGQVDEAIHAHLGPEDYTWFKARFDNQDNIFALFRRSDAYIMLHHVSVFDLSTLQAMSYACLPILSDIDGNLDLCGFDNGVLLDPEGDIKDAIEQIRRVFAQPDLLQLMKQKNARVVEEHFNNRAFLASYRDILGKGGV